jgi:hypothetical protein
MSERTNRPIRQRIVVGLDADGRSAVQRTDALEAISQSEQGVLHEVWRSSELPVHARDAGTLVPPKPTVPAGGAAVRLYTIMPNADGPQRPVELHCGSTLYVITVMDGRVVLHLETENVELEVGDTVLLPGYMHDVSNPSAETATIIYAAFGM